MRIEYHHLSIAGLVAAGQMFVAGPCLAGPEPGAGPAVQAVESWTPESDWRQSNDLETFSSVCEELALPERPGMDESDAVVIDVEGIGTEPTFVSLQDGTRLKVVRVAAGKIAIELVSRGVEDCAGGTQGLCPPKLPMADESGYDSRLAGFQSRYASLTAEGKTDEARALAATFLSDGAAGGDEPPHTLPEKVLRESAGLLQHRVSFNGKLPRYKAIFPSDARATWEEVSGRKITFTFRGATVDQAAEFLRVATGLAVEIDVPTATATSKRIHVSCRDQSIRSAVGSICRAGGLSHTVRENRIVLYSAD